MHLKMFSSISLLGARWKSKHQPRNKHSSRATSIESHMEPTLVFVQEKRASACDSESDSSSQSSYPTSLSVESNLSLQSACYHTPRAVADDNGLIMPTDLLKVVMSFIPIQSYTECAVVCQNWSSVVKYSAQRNKVEAHKLLSQGLTLMADSNTPLESVKWFTKAIDLFPKLTEASFWKAKGLFILSQDVAAVQCLEAALIQRPSTVERLKLQACIQYAHNNDLKASQLLEVALQKAPYDASIHFELGFCYHGLQQFARAVDCYSRALELNYHRTFVLYANRANCLFRVGKVNESMQDLEASLKISQFYELALRTRAFVNMHQGNAQLAYNDYTTIVEHAVSAKSKSDAYCNRAFCYGEMDEVDIERARQADPTNPEPVRYKASVLVNRGQTPEAIAHMTSWIDANPNHKDCSFQRAFRAELSATISDYAAAIKDYEGAIQTLLNSASSFNFSSCNVMETVSSYRQRLAELHHEQRRAAAAAAHQ